MTSNQRLLVAVTALNMSCAAISLSLIPAVNAAPGDVVPVVRTRHLEVVDNAGRARASITVYPANPGVRNPDGSPNEESVVFRLINGEGMPGVKLAISQHEVGLALIAKQGDYIQVFSDGVKVTKDFKHRAAWP